MLSIPGWDVHEGETFTATFGSEGPSPQMHALVHPPIHIPAQLVSFSRDLHFAILLHLCSCMRQRVFYPPEPPSQLVHPFFLGISKTLFRTVATLPITAQTVIKQLSWITAVERLCRSSSRRRCLRARSGGISTLAIRGLEDMAHNTWIASLPPLLRLESQVYNRVVFENTAVMLSASLVL